MKALCLALICLTASCGVYRTNFDCPPGRGIGCAPVNDVLDMIVERDEGEDLFVTDLGTALLLKQEEKEEKIVPKMSCVKRKASPSSLHLIKGQSGILVLEEIE